ncbi:MAG TPA: hypothetical protein VFR55_08250 [Dehalococcoidia bacterium]|nr:hypothetical protein [Dehalococcoidia bacterium]
MDLGIEAQRKAFMAEGLPVISIDTRDKELIGNWADNPQFAVDALASWWIGEDRRH